MIPAKRERLRVTGDAAIIEVHRFDDRTSRTESTFKPLCLSVAAIDSIEPFSSTHYPGVKFATRCSSGDGLGAVTGGSAADGGITADS